MLGAIVSGGATVAGGQIGGNKGAVPGTTPETASLGESTGASSAALGTASGAAGDAAAGDAGLGLGSLADTGAAAGSGEEAAALLSDPRTKTNVRPGAGKVTSMIRALDPKTFDYKDPGQPGAGPGCRVGVMAPALASTALGARAVRQDGPDEPMRLDTGNAVGLALAALPTLEARIRALEGRAHGR
jgi:hypothetical protein